MFVNTNLGNFCSRFRSMESYYKRKRDDEGPSLEPEGPEPEREAPEPEAQLTLALVEVEQPSQHEEPHTNEHVIFRGIEFLERDPALRPQIWQYPENVRDEVQREYLQLGPMQPKLKIYKPSGPQGHQRRFQFSWFNLFPWLEYSESNHCAYCFFCFLCSKNIKKRSGFDVYTAKGFDGWKRVNDGKKCAFLAHIGAGPCSQHNNAVRDCQAILNQSNHIATIIKVQSKKNKEKDRLRLRTSIATVKWLTFQSCAFRGHDETPESRNRGNFIEMLKLLGEFNPEIAVVILENSPHCSKYISHEIQQEILSIYAKRVRDHIRREIGDSKFSILVDETCDASKREQMTLVFRFFDKDGVLQERFFQLIHVRNTKALPLKRELRAELSKHSFDVKNLRGQGYDGASNMKGEFNGLQALFLKDCPYAYYVHCYAHRLQLALVAASKDVVPVSQFFQKLLFIINTVDSSSKRHDELHDAQVVEMSHLLEIGQIETGKGANLIRALKRPGDTRWGSHLGSISSLMDVFNPVNSVMQLIASDATAGTNRADGDTAFKYLTSFEFVFVLCIMREILGISEELGKSFQKNHRTL